MGVGKRGRGSGRSPAPVPALPFRSFAAKAANLPAACRRGSGRLAGRAGEGADERASASGRGVGAGNEALGAGPPPPPVHDPGDVVAGLDDGGKRQEQLNLTAQELLEPRHDGGPLPAPTSSISACRPVPEAPGSRRRWRPAGAPATGAALGNAWADLGEARKAIGFHEQDLAIRHEIGDRRGEGTALWNAALAYEEPGEREQAIERAKVVRRIRRAIEAPNGPKVAAWLRERGVDPDAPG